MLKFSLTAYCWLYDSVYLTGDERCPYRRNSWTVLTPWLEYKDAAEEKWCYLNKATDRACRAINYPRTKGNIRKGGRQTTRKCLMVFLVVELQYIQFWCQISSSYIRKVFLCVSVSHPPSLLFFFPPEDVWVLAATPTSLSQTRTSFDTGIKSRTKKYFSLCTAMLFCFGKSICIFSTPTST